MGFISEAEQNAAIRTLIAVRAYEVWENQGRPRGRDVIHWLQAEQEIMACVVKPDDTVARRQPGSAAAPPPQPA